MAQYGWHVNIGNCIGCRACEGACKQEFNLPVGVRRRFVVIEEGPSSGGPYRRHITSACMHCANPACVAACPVKRYWKDDASNGALRTAFGMAGKPPTGLVLIKPSKAEDPANGVDCIGCRQCVAACPYGAARFDEARSIADKCTGCYHRLFNENLPRERRLPACTVTCPALALHFDDLSIIDSGAYGVARTTTSAYDLDGAKEIGVPTFAYPSIRYAP